MTRLVARLVLAMLLLPISGAVMLIAFIATVGSSGPSVGGVLFVWSLVYSVIAIYWVLLWLGVVRWNRRRAFWTVIASGGSLAIGACAGALLLGFVRNIPPQIAMLFGGGFVPILWVLATVLIWRETPHERVERLSQLGTAGVCCPICGYNLTGLTTAQCPECGTKFTLDQLMATQPRERAGM